MRRREFIALLGGAAFWPRCAQAQQPKMFRIGLLNLQNPEPLRGFLLDALRDLGYVDGQNLRIEYHAASGDHSKLLKQAAELVHVAPDAIVAYPTPAVVAVKGMTRDIPIVMLGAGDPVGTGIVASLARPGGNITGTSSTTSEAGAKTLEVLRDLLPSLRRVAVLANATDAFTKSFLAQMQVGGQSTRLEIQTIMIREPGELAAAFADMQKNAAEAVVVQPSLPRDAIAELAIKHRLPSIAPSGGYATAGGLAAYSASQKEMGRRSAAIIDKILKGSKPADLPVEQPTTFELVINLKTAKAIGLAVPPTLLSRADEVIE